MSNTIRELIEQLRFDEAFDQIKDIPVDDLSTMLISMTHERSDIRPLTFVVSRLTEDRNWKWHYLTSLLLSQPLCHLEGAYSAAFYHANEAVKLAPDDWTLKEYLLFFHCIPDRLLSDDDARVVAKQILEKDPNNQTAKLTVSACDKRR